MTASTKHSGVRRGFWAIAVQDPKVFPLTEVEGYCDNSRTDCCFLAFAEVLACARCYPIHSSKAAIRVSRTIGATRLHLTDAFRLECLRHPGSSSQTSCQTCKSRWCSMEQVLENPPYLCISCPCWAARFFWSSEKCNPGADCIQLLHPEGHHNHCAGFRSSPDKVLAAPCIAVIVVNPIWLLQRG